MPPALLQPYCFGLVRRPSIASSFRHVMSKSINPHKSDKSTETQLRMSGSQKWVLVCHSNGHSTAAKKKGTATGD